MNSAFRDIILLKDYALLKAVGVAILVSMIRFLPFWMRSG